MIEIRARRVLAFPLTRMVLALGLLGAIAGPPILLLARARVLGPTLTQLIVTAAALLALSIVVRLVERRPFLATFFPARGAAPDLGVGFLLGAGLFAAVLGILAAPGFFAVGGFAPNVAPLAILRALALFFVVALFEETVFRAVVFRMLEELLGTWTALGMSSILFGLAHLQQPHATVTAAIAIALEAGVLLGAVYVQHRTLWLPIGLHWSWNFFEGPVFGTSVSGSTALTTIFVSRTSGPTLVTGGEFGPEAGMAALAVCLGAGLWFCVRAAKRGATVPPMWRHP